MATSPDVETLERETAEARARLANTLDRLTSPETAQAVKQELTDYAQGLKESVLGTGRSKAQGYTDDLKQRVLANPLGVALIGAGIGWRLYKHPPITTLLLGTGIALLMKGNSAQRHFREYHDPYNPEHPAAYVPGGVAGYGYPVDEQAPGASLTERAGSAASRTGEMAQNLGSKARDTASGVGERVSEAVDTARSSAASAAETARTAVSDAAETARTAVLSAAEAARTTVSEAAASARTAVSDIAERTTSTITHSADYARRRASGLAEQAQTSPVLLGALGLAVGTAIAYSLRASEIGDRMTAGSSRGRDRRRAPERGYRGAKAASGGPRRSGRSASGMASAAGEGLGDAASRVRETASDIASSAAETVSGVADAAGRVLGAATETVSSTASGAYETASSGYRRAAGLAASAGRRAQAGRVQQQLAELGERYPLLLGAVSLAVGAAVGGSLRLSESENRLMGPVSDRFKQRARELADEQLGLAREAAEQFAGDLGSQFSAGERQDTSADFETVIGGGQPEAATTGPEGGRRPPMPSL